VRWSGEAGTWLVQALWFESFAVISVAADRTPNKNPALGRGSRFRRNHAVQGNAAPPAPVPASQEN
jgi:hypothetical protein